MAEKPFPTPKSLTEQLQNLCWRLATEMRAIYNTVKTKLSKDEADGYYLAKDGKAASATAADTATKASQDAKGNVIDTFYAKNTSIPTVMTGATSAVGGKAGLVPIPAAGAQAKYLRGDGTWQAVATVATSGKYSDLTGRPTIPAKVSDLTNDSGFAVASSLAKVATSGKYSDLSGKPTIPSKVSELTNDQSYVSSSALSQVAKTGLYADIVGIPDLSVKLDTSELKTALSELITKYGGTVPAD